MATNLNALLFNKISISIMTYPTGIQTIEAFGVPYTLRLAINQK